MEKEIVSGITYSRDEAQVTLVGVPDRPGVAASIFGPLADANINVDMIVQNVGTNREATDLTEEVMRITGGKGVEAVCENVADPELFRKALYSMKHGATMVTAGNASGNIEVPLDIRRLYLFQLHIVGEPREQPGGLAKAFAKAGEGGVKTIIDTVLPLSQAAEGHRRVAGRGGVGKVLLDPTLD